MSDLVKGLLEAATPALAAKVQGLAQEYLNGLEGTVEGLTGPVKDAALAHMAKAADYRFKAIQSDDASRRAAYVDGAADELRSAKTVLTSEGTAISLEQAETLLAGFEQVLSAVGSAAKGIITALASGIASGAVAGLVGGGGGSADLSSIFPGA